MTKILLLLLDNHHWKWRADTYKVEIFSPGNDSESDVFSDVFLAGNDLSGALSPRSSEANSLPDAADSTVRFYGDVLKRPLIVCPGTRHLPACIVTGSLASIAISGT